MLDRAFERRRDVRVLAREVLPRDTHELEYLAGDCTHAGVLRLVRIAVRVAAQRRDHQDRNPEGLRQRRQRVDGIPESGVLEQRDAAHASQLGARGDRHRVALVCGTDVS